MLCAAGLPDYCVHTSEWSNRFKSWIQFKYSIRKSINIQIKEIFNQRNFVSPKIVGWIISGARFRKLLHNNRCFVQQSSFFVIFYGFRKQGSGKYGFRKYTFGTTVLEIGYRELRSLQTILCLWRRTDQKSNERMPGCILRRPFWPC